MLRFPLSIGRSRLRERFLSLAHTPTRSLSVVNEEEARAPTPNFLIPFHTRIPQDDVIYQQPCPHASPFLFDSSNVHLINGSLVKKGLKLVSPEIGTLTFLNKRNLKIWKKTCGELLKIIFFHTFSRKRLCKFQFFFLKQILSWRNFVSWLFSPKTSKQSMKEWFKRFSWPIFEKKKMKEIRQI